MGQRIAFWETKVENAGRPRVRCQVQQFGKKNCRLGLGSLSGQLGKVGIGGDSFLPLSIKVARRVDMTGQFKQWIAEAVCFA